MSKDRFSLSLANAEDFESFLRLKSEPLNIYWSGFSAAPTPSNLRKHFIKSIDSSSRDIYLLRDGSDVLGYLYADKRELEDEIEVAYGISELHSGLGLAKVMISMFMQQIAPHSAVIVAWIAERNVASIKTVQTLGFQVTNEFIFKKLEQDLDPIKFLKFFCEVKKIL